MDIHPLNIKQFTLTAITYAILTFHAEVTNAASCPTQINGSSLAGTVCDFNSGSSVTVTNGGEVGGIDMSSYTPLSPSQLVIDAGGLISSNDPGGFGIHISASSLSHGLSNSGTISSASGSGISISNTSVINGGLSNSGLISSNNLGISINQSDINGGIFNTGTIDSTNGSGISVRFSSNVTGGIFNSGTIKAGGVDVGISIISQSTIDGGITNDGLIEATADGNGITMHGSSSINGGITNHGTIKSVNQTGIGILNLSQVQGNISNSGIISGGTKGLSIHNASTVNGSILNTGTIEGASEKGISIYSSTSISGGISNSGVIQGGNTGIAVESSSIISGGISNSGIIQGAIDAIRISSNSAVSHIDILGQSARMIGAVDAPNTTINIMSGAIFTSEGTFNVDNFNIQSNATFMMANAITANDVNNAGTLALGDTLQTITGNYTQNNGAVLQINASSATNYGQLGVTGNVDLSQSGNINVQVTQNAVLHKGDVLTNVISGSTLVMPSDGFNVSDNSFLWRFIARSSSGTGINLVAIIDPTATKTCGGDYCEGAATTIINQVASGNPIFNPYALLSSANAFKAAASEATPELTNENIQAIQLITTSVMDLVPMWNNLHANSTNDAMIYQPNKIWFKPYGGSMTQNEKNTVNGFNATAYGIVIGRDMSLTEDWLLGGAFALGKDNLHGKSVLDNQTIDSDDYQAMIYAARKFPHHFYLAGQGLVGYGNNTTERSIPLYSSTARGSFNSWFSNLRAQTGWRNYFVNENLILTPVFDMSYLFVNQGSYQEQGSAMDLKVAASNTSSLVLGAYGHGAYRFILKNKQDLAMTGYIGVARDVLNTQPETTATFIAGGPSFSTFGVEFNELVFRGGLGLTLESSTKPLRVNINYDLQVGNHAYSNMGSLIITYKL